MILFALNLEQSCHSPNLIRQSIQNCPPFQKLWLLVKAPLRHHSKRPIDVRKNFPEKKCLAKFNWQIDKRVWKYPEIMNRCKIGSKFFANHLGILPVLGSLTDLNIKPFNQDSTTICHRAKLFDAGIFDRFFQDHTPSLWKLIQALIPRLAAASNAIFANFDCSEIDRKIEYAGS